MGKVSLVSHTLLVIDPVHHHAKDGLFCPPLRVPCGAAMNWEEESLQIPQCLVRGVGNAPAPSRSVGSQSITLSRESVKTCTNQRIETESSQVSFLQRYCIQGVRLRSSQLLQFELSRACCVATEDGLCRLLKTEPTPSFKTPPEIC